MIGFLMLALLGMCSQKSDVKTKDAFNGASNSQAGLSSETVSKRSTQLTEAKKSSVASYTSDALSERETLGSPVCGWFEQLEPLVAKFYDYRGEWLLEGADRDENWPLFRDDQWVEIPEMMGYGYGCACVEFDPVEDRKIGRLRSSQSASLSACRANRDLPPESLFLER